MIQKIKTILDHYGFTYQDLLDKNQESERVMVRQLCYVIMRQNKIPYKIIGEFFGLHYSTIIRGVQNFYDLLETKDQWALEAFEFIEQTH